MAPRRFISAVGSGLLILLLCGTAFAAEPRAYITRGFSNQVTVFDTASASVVANVTVGEEPIGVAVTPTRAYVANLGSNTVSVIDTATNTVVTTIPVGLGPYGVAVDAAGQRVWVTTLGDSSVSVIDTATNTVVYTLAVGNRPKGIVLHPNGTRAFVASANSGTLEVIEMTPSDGPMVVSSVAIGGQLEAIAVSPDGTRVWIPHVQGTTGYRLAVVDASTSSGTVLNNVVLTAKPRGVTVDPQARRVYVGHPALSSITVVDAQTLGLLPSIPGVGWGAFGLTVNPAAPQLWVAVEDEDHVAVVDTSTGAVAAIVEVLDGPAAFGSFIAAPAQSGCDDSLETAVEGALGKVEAAMSRAFHAGYTVPGDTAGARVRRLGQGVTSLSRGHLTGVYQNLLRPQGSTTQADPAICDEALRTAVQAMLSMVEGALKTIDSNFSLPGNGLVSRLEYTADAVARLDRGRLQGLYWVLR